ncbi:MAG: hypothetical protein AAF384_04910 [Pseudomonadota bacterium]
MSGSSEKDVEEFATGIEFSDSSLGRDAASTLIALLATEHSIDDLEIEAWRAKLLRQAQVFLAHDGSPVAVELATVGEIKRPWWRGWWGPSRREISLSIERSEALQRAERAEAMCFEAVAESAKAAAERDEVLAKLENLNLRLKDRPDDAS